MSGPKVIRIVTKEELLAESNAILARLEKKFEIWKKAADALGDEAVDDIATTLLRKNKIIAYLNDENFAQFNKKALQEISYLAVDLETRHEQAASKLASQQQSQLRMKQNAKMLLKLLEKNNLTQNLNSLRNIAAGKFSDDSQTVLLAAYKQVDQTKDKDLLTTNQKELASRLVLNEKEESYEEWKKESLKNKIDTRFENVSRKIGSLKILLGQDAVATFETQFESLFDEKSLDRQSMLVDSLLLDVGKADQIAKENLKRAERAEVLIYELSRQNDKRAKDYILILNNLISITNPNISEQVIQEGEDLLNLLKKNLAAGYKREAILKGLQNLGYEVNEGMETSWVENGSFVIRKPGQNGYGVEFSGPPGLDRLQVRSVAFNESRDNSQDIKAEETWCTDFTKLSLEVSQDGSEIFLDKALGVGKVPLKVANSESGHKYSEDVDTTQNSSFNK